MRDGLGRVEQSHHQPGLWVGREMFEVPGAMGRGRSRSLLEARGKGGSKPEGRSFREDCRLWTRIKTRVYIMHAGPEMCVSAC
jgi:hypothetical protein